MPSIGSAELILVLLVAFLVVGPRDLPRMMRTVGQWTRKARLMATEFQHNLDAMAKEADLEDLKNDAMAIKREADGIKNTIADPFKDPLKDPPKEQMKEMASPVPEKFPPGKPVSGEPAHGKPVPPIKGKPGA